MRAIVAVVSACAVLSGCASLPPAGPPAIDAARLNQHVSVLASDEFEGRGPTTPGEEKTVAYLAEQFRRLGLEGAGPGGSFVQEVPLYRFERTGAFNASFNGRSWSRPLRRDAEVIVGTQRPLPRISVERAPVVFVGYGVKAAERNWDDFKGADLKGKLLLMLVNDPDFEVPAGHPTAGRFDGKAMTYYGRWTYKFEEAARQGAAGVLVIHETAGAGYGWSTLEGSAPTPQFDIVRPDPAAERAAVQGWVQRLVVEEMLRRAGLNFEQLKAAAQRQDFRPVEVPGATFSADFGVKSERVMSRNVLARVRGSSRPNETVLYGAHWDAFGRSTPDATGDDIYNGAVDNASALGALLELARVFAQGPRPQRSVMFASWAAEEKGLLGAEHYAANPTAPLETTVANLNMDSLLPGPPEPEIVVIGFGKGELEDRLGQLAAAQGRRLIPDPAPQAGAFYRSDHFSLARMGVPVLFPSAGFTGASAASRDYVANRYHKPSDEWDPSWDMSGAAQDVELLHVLGRELANGRQWPGWKPGAEFGAARTASAAARR